MAQPDLTRAASVPGSSPSFTFSKVMVTNPRPISATLACTAPNAASPAARSPRRSPNGTSGTLTFRIAFGRASAASIQRRTRLATAAAVPNSVGREAAREKATAGHPCAAAVSAAPTVPECRIA